MEAELAHDRLERWRTIATWSLAAAFLLVGILHLRAPDTFLPIVPGWVPFPRETVLATGVCELGGGIGLFVAGFRMAAGIGLALSSGGVYPANIKHAVDHVTIGTSQLGWWYHVPRLAFQPVIVWWALFAGRVTSWPFARKRAGAARSTRP